MKNIFDLSFEEIEAFVVQAGEKKFHAKQIWHGLYRHLFQDWAQFTDLSKTLRSKLAQELMFGGLFEENKIESYDTETQKTLFKLTDGNFFESVLLKKLDRITLCISTQSGCPVGCAFCATGNLGFFRHLSTGEIIEQALIMQRQLVAENKKITNIVFMGMGEPFLNYDNVMKAVALLNHKDGLNLGARRITISTIGILDKIKKFAQEESQVNLSVSLHAPTDELRRKLIPLASSYHVSDLIKACKYYFEKTNRRVTFEYVMIENLNDQPQHAHQLAALLNGLNSHINLIPLNSTKHYAGNASNKTVIKEFGRILLDHGITLTIRESQGSEISAGCGQLAALNQK